MRLKSLAISVVLFLLAQSSVYGNERIKTFAAQQCRYTLPSNKWNWIDHSEVRNAVCAAEHEDGRVIVLIISPFPKDGVINQSFVDLVDKDAAASLEKTKKRGGRITTFKNLPCYEFERLLEGAMVASRIVLANGYGYHVVIRGGVRPVEKLPDYEAIMDGFEFTSPPVPHTAGAVDPLQKGKDLSRRVGKSVAYMIPLGMVAIFWLAGRKTRARKGDAAAL